MDIFGILGRASPAACEDLLGWIEDELARDERRLGRPLAYEDLQRAYGRAVSAAAGVHSRRGAASGS
jgi:hypothetical protein